MDDNEHPHWFAVFAKSAKNPICTSPSTLWPHGGVNICEGRDGDGDEEAGGRLLALFPSPFDDDDVANARLHEAREGGVALARPHPHKSRGPRMRGGGRARNGLHCGTCTLRRRRRGRRRIRRGCFAIIRT